MNSGAILALARRWGIHAYALEPEDVGHHEIRHEPMHRWSDLADCAYRSPHRCSCGDWNERCCARATQEDGLCDECRSTCAGRDRLNIPPRKLTIASEKDTDS